MTAAPAAPAAHDEPLVEVALEEGALAARSFPGGDACASGAVVVFAGRTRDERDADLGPLERLHYEAHAPLALAGLRAIALAEGEHAGARHVRIRHALGAVPPGATSLEVAVAAPHRAEAFRCCSRIVDRLKSEAAIWKREDFAGGRRWSGAAQPLARGTTPGTSPESGRR